MKYITWIQVLSTVPTVPTDVLQEPCTIKILLLNPLSTLYRGNLSWVQPSNLLCTSFYKKFTKADRNRCSHPFAEVLYSPCSILHISFTRNEKTKMRISFFPDYHEGAVLCLHFKEDSVLCHIHIVRGR